jgi:LPS export ABC transporter protein LptC
MKLIYSVLIASLAIIGFASCENSIEVVNMVSKTDTSPVVKGDQVEFIYSDSGKVQVKMVAPVMKRYETPKKKTEFPKGIHVFFYDKQTKVIAEITANKSLFHEDTKLWDAEGNVVVKNDKGEQLNTEKLTWNQNTKQIYSKVFTRIINKDNVLYGENGFVSNQNFTQWKLIGSKGTVKIDE